MKKKVYTLPIIFFIFGIVLTGSIVGLSIKKHLQQNIKPIAYQEICKDSNEDKLFFEKPNKTLKNVHIKVYKDKRILELFNDENLIGRFKVALGRAPSGDKEKEGDSKTPEGSYYICSRTSATKYYYFMGLSYPNDKDAKKALAKGSISTSTYNKIIAAIEKKQQPPWETSLGGAVGIHGGSNKYDWTYGCIAVSDENMAIIKEYTAFNTLVEIYK